MRKERNRYPQTPAEKRFCEQIADDVRALRRKRLDAIHAAKENEDMGFKLPPPSVRQRPKEFTRLPYLKPEHLHGRKELFEIDRVVPEATQYSDVQVVGKIRGDGYILGVSFTNPNYPILYEAFGADLDNWKGKAFAVESVFNKTLQTDLIDTSIVTDEQITFYRSTNRFPDNEDRPLDEDETAAAGGKKG